MIDSLLFEKGENLSLGLMTCRAVLLFLSSLIILRLSHRRLLSRAAPFDTILLVVIGSVLSRGINGSSDLISTLGVTVALVASHWLISYLSFHSRTFGRLTEGYSSIIIKDGQINKQNMEAAHLTNTDLKTALREHRVPDVKNVKEARLENDGKISVLGSGKPYP